MILHQGSKESSVTYPPFSANIEMLALQLTSMANFDCLIEFPLQTWFLLFAMWCAAGRVSDPQRTAHTSPHTPPQPASAQFNGQDSRPKCPRVCRHVAVADWLINWLIAD